MIAFFATIVRYYDYALFGLSASVLAMHFMPGADDSEKMFAFFALFALSVTAKPFGSIIFGKIGDKMGRIASVKIATILAAISTFFIALIPNYEYAGFFSVTALIFLRMLFLLSLAGEVDAIKLYVSEKISKKHRHFAAGLVSFSSQIGVLIASILYYFAISSENAELLWRMNFALGGIFGICVVLMRGLFRENKDFFKQTSKVKAHEYDGTWKIIKKYRIKFCLSIIVNGMIGGSYHFLIIFLSAFIAKFTNFMNIESASSSNIILISIYGCACILSGYVADRVNVIMQASVALMTAIFVVLFMEFMLELDIFSVFFHRMLVFVVPFFTIPCTILVQSLFPINVRMRLYSLSRSIGSMLFSSTTPFFCMLVWKHTQMVAFVLFYFLVQLGILFFALSKLTKHNYVNMFDNID